MNQVKFQYNIKATRPTIEFFVTFKGTKVIVLTAVLATMDFSEIKRLRSIAQGEAQVVLSQLKLAA